MPSLFPMSNLVGGTLLPSRLRPVTLLLKSSLFFPCGLYNTFCLSAGNGFFYCSGHSNHKFYSCLDHVTFLCPVSPVCPFHSSCKSLVYAFTPHPSFSNRIHSTRKGLISSTPQQHWNIGSKLFPHARLAGQWVSAVGRTFKNLHF